MCFSRERHDHDELREIRADEPQKEHRPKPWENTTPRGNQEPDPREMEREAERLTTVVGA